MKIAITGGRDYKLKPMDWFWLGGTIAKLTKENPDLLKSSTLIHGDAPGVDTEVSEYIGGYFKVVAAFPADWGRLGNAAGPIRNRAMADLAEILLVFPGGNGTRNMVEACSARKVPIRYSPGAFRALYPGAPDLPGLQ